MASHNSPAIAGFQLSIILAPLQEENKRLRMENEGLRAENKGLSAEKKAFILQVKELKRQIRRQKSSLDYEIRAHGDLQKRFQKVIGVQKESLQVVVFC